MDAGRLRRETGGLCHSLYDLTRVMADAMQGFQEYFDVLVSPKINLSPFLRKELLALGIREYRQTHFKPYRLIYRVSGKQVIIYLIADGRRDMQTLLMRRMLGV